jgi:hypothetical protein
MKFFQGPDPNIGEPGFLSYHRQVRFFLMMDDINRMKRNWREHKAFSKFATKVDGMTNERLKKLKEEMVSAFLTKMTMQIRKHNKRYLLTRNLVCSVFSEWQTGQAVAQFLKGGEPSLSAPFFSALHGREIDCEKFFQFMQDEVPLTVLEELRSDPAVAFQQDAIDKIAVSGLNIWDRTTPNALAHLFCQRALQEYAAQASTQHNNERLVKLGAQMASTGKGEIMASIFAIASNNFKVKYHDDTHLQPANQPADAPAEAETQPSAEEDDSPKQRNRGNNRGRMKLMDLERVVKRKKIQLATVASTLGPVEYRQRCKRIDTSLKSKEENLHEKSGKAKSQKLLQHIDENKAPNAQQRKQGEDLPPRLLGFFLYSGLGLKADVAQLEQELEAREVLFDRKLGVTKKLEVLKMSELRCFEAVVDNNLCRRGYASHPDLKLPAKIELIKQDAKEKEEQVGGEYDVDMTKFFKLVSTDVDKTIFDDPC